MRMESAMFDRHWLGDIALAVLVALPLIGLAKPQPVSKHPTVSTYSLSVPSTARTPGGRLGVMG